jgi:natural product biosynthesis luciferase-like monooxygenase protein
MFFGIADSGDNKYRTILDLARLADELGFHAAWVPERHFHEFGGLSPNPALIAAAIASQTSRIAVRAGSVVAPLHHPIRIAEEWAVVDNLSGGRVGVSFGSGWNVEDFVLADANAYTSRKTRTIDIVKFVRELWECGSALCPQLDGGAFRVELHPRPLQRQLPCWLTSSGDIATFRMAGELGCNVLTHLLSQSVEELSSKIAAYREALAHRDPDAAGVITTMVHAYVMPDRDQARERVREPMRRYLRSALNLEQKSAGSGGNISGGLEASSAEVPESITSELVDVAFDRYFDGDSLLGTPVKCAEVLDRLAFAGVDEVACLIDFGVPLEDALESLRRLDLVGRAHALVPTAAARP